MSATPERELRCAAVPDLRIERRADGEGSRVIGHAAVFDQWSEDLGGFRERIMPGAFAEAIKRDDVRALFNHDNNFVLGRSAAGTLGLSEDRIGLRTIIDLPATTFAEDLATSMQRGDITGMSFAFSVRAEDQEWEQVSGSYRRTINRVEKLWDVSVVTVPAYPQTAAAVRMLDAVRAAAGRSPEDLTAAAQKQRLRLIELEEEFRREQGPEAVEEAQRRRWAKIQSELKGH